MEEDSGQARMTIIMTSRSFQSIGQVLKKGNPVSDRDKYFSQEFQAYGYYLAKELGDLSHKALYIKYAKTLPRGILEEALSVVKNAIKVKSKAKLFLWKIKQLKRAWRGKKNVEQWGYA